MLKAVRSPAIPVESMDQDLAQGQGRLKQMPMSVPLLPSWKAIEATLARLRRASRNGAATTLRVKNYGQKS